MFGLRLVCLALGFVVVLGSNHEEKSKLRVFVLAGQSNMEGKGSIDHLVQLLNDTSTADLYRHLWDYNQSDFVQRSDVLITFNGEKHGSLTVGYGVPEDRFGPELQFGHVVGDAFNQGDDQILIIKCAWGGKALAVEFRPPSSGTGNYTKADPDTQERVPIKPLEYGFYYRETIRIVQDVMANIADVVPNYDPDKVDAQLSGLVWFQGFNDVIDEMKINEYGANLVNLIRDIRLDLGAPELPVIVGELGMGGVDMEPQWRYKHLRFRHIEEGVTLMEEFRHTTAYAKTSIYVVKDAESFDGDYHYYGRADTFFHIGNAFGEAMIPLVQDKKKHAARFGLRGEKNVAM